ncbi:MAG TPA: type 4a pilus biogenesis protein PilO [Blastocatellia bacterium]|nr:type 4a pilus biogenesis protein PilO [Blastocatellia bacterium]
MSATMTTVVKGAEEGGSFLNRMPWYGLMGLLLVIVALLIFAADMMLYSETRTQTAELLSKADDLKVKNQQGDIIRANLEETERTLALKREEMDTLRDLLPDQVEISRVYDNIKDLMKGRRLELKQFAQDKPESSEIYTAQKILVQVSGSYDSLGLFFSDLGFYKRIVSVTDVDVKQAEDNAQEYGRSINSSFVVTAYYISPENLERLNKKPDAPPPANGTPANGATPPANGTPAAK